MTYTHNNLARLDHDVWEFISEDMNGISYYNKKKITKSSDIISVWIYYGGSDAFRDLSIRLSELNEDWKEYEIFQNYHHHIMLYEFDCKNELYRITDVIYYNNEGEIIGSSDVTDISYIHRWSEFDFDYVKILYKKVLIAQRKLLKQ